MFFVPCLTDFNEKLMRQLSQNDYSCVDFHMKNVQNVSITFLTQIFPGNKKWKETKEGTITKTNKELDNSQFARNLFFSANGMTKTTQTMQLLQVIKLNTVNTWLFCKKTLQKECQFFLKRENADGFSIVWCTNNLQEGKNLKLMHKIFNKILASQIEIDVQLVS